MHAITEAENGLLDQEETIELLLEQRRRELVALGMPATCGAPSLDALEGARDAVARAVDLLRDAAAGASGGGAL